jgi:hypothetical protein
MRYCDHWLLFMQLELVGTDFTAVGRALVGV